MQHMQKGNTRRRRKKNKERNRRTLETRMTENFSKITSDTKPQTQEVQRTPSRVSDQKTIYIIFKLQKTEY